MGGTQIDNRDRYGKDPSRFVASNHGIFTSWTGADLAYDEPRGPASPATVVIGPVAR